MFGKALLLVIASTISVHGFAVELQGECWGGQNNNNNNINFVQLIEMAVLETAEDDMESRIFTSGGGLNLNSTTLTLLGRILLLDKIN